MLSVPQSFTFPFLLWWQGLKGRISSAGRLGGLERAGQSRDKRGQMFGLRLLKVSN